jgi:hypothetical protein
MRSPNRPPSYSDSFIVRSPSINGTPVLEPLYIPLPDIPKIDSIESKSKLNIDGYILFVIKCSLHILFISSFESIFYFLYVSQSENAGILKVIDAYYQPLISNIGNWSNTSKLILLDILNYELNKTTIDKAGSTALINRRIYNMSLMNLSIGYSIFFLGIFGIMCTTVYLKRVKIKWRKLFIEHLSFIVLLGLYEYFFYITIIYKYTTVSTDELNQYIVDGLYKALN